MKYHYQILLKADHPNVTIDSAIFYQEDNIFKGYDTEDIAKCQGAQHIEDYYPDVRNDYYVKTYCVPE
jgi:hypothetical protein